MELKFNFEKPAFDYIKDQDEAVLAVEELNKHECLGIDIEATGLDPYSDTLLLVQIGTPLKTIIFDAQKLDLTILKDILEDSKILKLMQNAKFDYAFIKQKLGIEVANIYDTMLAEGVLTAGLGKPLSLAALSEKYLGVRLDKSVRKSFEGLKTQITDDQLKYAALDTLVLFPIFNAQKPLMVKEDVVRIAKLEFAVTRVVSEMELRGISIDVKKWREILKELTKKRDVIALEFQNSIRNLYISNQIDLFGNMSDSININSQQQLMDLFNKKLGINLPSTGDNILANIRHPIAKLLRDYRGYEKLISAFGEGLLEKVSKVTGKLHPDFIQLGAATGRFACSNPNLQQIPRNSLEAPFRECFVPSPGYKLVVCDYSSMEMRILADLSGDVKMINALKDGLDIHSYTAALMFNKEFTPDFKKRYADLRQIAKPIGFGLMYGMGPVGLAKRLEVETGKPVSTKDGENYMNKYFESYPSVQKFLLNMARNAIKNGWSTTPAGRKRWYTKPEPDDPEFRRKISNIERQAKNHPIQGTNADVTKYALVFLRDRLKKEKVDGFVTHTVHDEIVCEVRSDQAQDWGVIQKEEMIRAGSLILKKVPVGADVSVGDVWEH